jgi:hypothetical protein
MPWRVKVGKKTVGCARKKKGAKKLAAGRKKARIYKVKSCAR